MNRREQVYFGDLHNHCNMSYAHGDLEDAVRNARQRLDFCSVTGHAHWTDMPKPTKQTQHIIDFHVEGFEKLKKNWPASLETLKAAFEPGRFVTFPGFEVHSSADGDRAVIYQEPEGDLLYPGSIPDLEGRIAELVAQGHPALSLPHHIGYHQGARGINWDHFNADTSPVVEVYSMHGASESTEGPLPFLHSMGPADWRSTVQYGLAQGHIFGFVANTDHHSAHPGSYGHGMTGIWTRELSRESIFEAIRARRTFALTGDKTRLDYELGGTPMGGIRPPGRAESLTLYLEAGGAIDYVDVVLNNRTVRRISWPELPGRGTTAAAGSLQTHLFLEVGWGPRGKAALWDAEVGISAGTILEVDPRFRGPDVLSPEQEAEGSGSAFYSRWERAGDRSVHFETKTYGNPTSSTPGTAGIDLLVDLPTDARIWTRLNGVRSETTVERLLSGGRSGHIRHEIDSPAYLLHQAPREEEYRWNLTLDDFAPDLRPGDFIYLRVRQKNNQWAWGSPIFVR